MFFATHVQQLEFVRAQMRAQDESGTTPAQTVQDSDSPDAKRAALLVSTFRPQCGCNAANGPVPCDAAILSVLSAEPVAGCPNLPPTGE